MIKSCLSIGILIFFLTGVPAFAQENIPKPDMKSDMKSDMRSDYKAAALQRKLLIQKAQSEKQEAAKQAKTKALLIKNDKQALKKGIAELRSRIKTIKIQNKTIHTRVNKLKTKEAQLTNALEKTQAVNQEFSEFAGSNAKNLQTIMLQSLQSGLIPGRHGFLTPIINGDHFPGMDDINKIADRLFEEINLSGRVALTRGRIIDRKGKEQEANLLILGNFTGIYQLDKEIGFLLYSEQSQRYFALSKLPSAEISRKMSAYIQGKSNDVYMDISKGNAIRQLTHELKLAQQIPKGGAIVWPILIILLISGLILVERIIFFTRRQTNAKKLMETIKNLIMADDWAGCQDFLESKKFKLIPKVLLTAIAFKDQTREDMENALQESILGEIPKIERFLSTLGMLAAIAPLLGLLGTVTGMINTFHVITYYGASDPRMMSGGISEALVTTMLGLAVAIPIMVAHTFLNRRVETQISKMEEKSVAFVNLVFKKRNKDRR
ncbi:MAG: MotA/TolQ/ExbB proton channel family protein [Desulfobacteraceae bacterium]|nr:MotA/TolQ/ExbB proton channel family protein [Desulfobacteraceae bacterium]